jgi:hypothetical protein
MAERERKEPQSQGPLDQTHGLLDKPCREKAECCYKAALMLWRATPLYLLIVFSTLSSAGWTATASAAPNQSAAQINKFALSAYCIETREKSRLAAADGQVPYKRITELASDRALLDHPGIFKDSASWKIRIVAMLDQYGDEPAQLCKEGPDR